MPEGPGYLVAIALIVAIMAAISAYYLRYLAGNTGFLGYANFHLKTGNIGCDQARKIEIVSVWRKGLVVQNKRIKIGLFKQDGLKPAGVVGFK